MAAANNITGKIGEVHNAVAVDDIFGATNILMDLIRDHSERNYMNEVTLMRNGFTVVDKEYRQQLLDYEKHKFHRNKLIGQMLRILDEVKEEIYSKQKLVV